MPRLSVIVAIRDQLAMNRLFEESLRASTDGDYELIVVDNASTDGSREYLASRGARIVANDRNYGYARCQNQGLAVASGEVLAFLNNDLILSPHWDSRLLSVMARQGLDVATPCSAENVEDRAATRRLMRRWKRIKYPLFLAAGPRRWTLRATHRLMYGDWAAFADARWARFGDRVKEGFVGAAVVMTRRAVELLGEWDPQLQAADFDLFLRTKQRHRERGDLRPCHVALGVYVHHYVRLTLKSRPPPFADRALFQGIEEKWGPEVVARDLAHIDD
jgi:GT2 family glycosyltransferase